MGARDENQSKVRSTCKRTDGCQLLGSANPELINSGTFHASSTALRLLVTSTGLETALGTQITQQPGR